MAEVELKPSVTPAELRALNNTYYTVKYDAAGKIVEANNNFLRLLEYAIDDLIGQDFSKFVSKSQDRTKHAALWRSLAEGEPQHETALYVTARGEEVWLESWFVPIIDETDGSVAEIVQIASDVGAQLARQSDERSQIAAIQATQAVAQFSLEGEILDANPLFLQALGYELEALVGRPHSILVDANEVDAEAQAAFWGLLLNGQHHAGDFRRLHRDGSDVWLQAVYSPIFDAAGRMVKIVQYAADITEEKLRQADYESQIKAIRKSNSVVTYDMHGTILEANDLFLAATGYKAPDIVGRHHRMFVEKGYAHGAQYAGFWNDLRKGQHRAGQYKRLAKGGREIWLQATYNPVFDAQGKAIKVVEYASPVTDERMVQAEHQGQIAAIHQTQCVVSFELDGTITDANDNFLKATGYRFADVRGKHHSMFVGEEMAKSDAYKEFWRNLVNGSVRSGEFKRYTKDGREIWLQASYNPIYDLNGRLVKIVKYAIDITEDKLRRADHSSQIEAIYKTQCVTVFDMDGVILDVNQNFLDVLGYGLDDLRGKHHSLLLEREFAASPAYIELWDRLRAGEHQSGMFKRLGKDGREVWIQASYNPILDLNGVPCKVVKYATDVTSNVALAEAFEDAKRQAQHDFATSLPNRAKLANFMNGHLAGSGGALTVFYIDLDRFKQINDTYGHHVGDRVLGEVADRLRRSLREDQLVARVGGDEFVIAAPSMPPEAIERFCAALYQQVTRPIRYDNGELTITMSIGVALSPIDGETPDDLLRAADAALYQAKEEGRGRYSFYDRTLNERIQGQRRLIEDMRHSLNTGDFYLEFQPRFDAQSNEIRSAEALVRWAHPERGRVNPGEFIQLAEQSGLILPLGDWILQHACETAAGWGGIGVSVNVSPIQFRDAGFVKRVEQCLKKTKLPPKLLEIEITEGVLIDDATSAIETLNGLKRLGVGLAMDDFGTGYSSLSYLRSFPFDVIKIDRSFINDLDAPDGGRPIVQAIVGLARALGLKVTAEGVETDAQLQALAAERCDEVQGFLMARPLTSAQISEFIQETRRNAA